jgi:CTP-dependent riboflavin kinase
VTGALDAVDWSSMTRFIFITGGVVSSLGKGQRFAEVEVDGFAPTFLAKLGTAGERVC